MKLPRAPKINYSYHNYMVNKFTESLMTWEGVWSMNSEKFELKISEDSIERNYHEKLLAKHNIDFRYDFSDDTDEDY